MADKETEVQQTEGQVSPPEDKEVDITKIVSERINKERERIRNETLDEQAKSLGYVDHADFLANMQNEKIIKNGLDPDEIKPLLKDLLESNPEYKEALKYKKEKEELEKNIWANQELQKLNTKYGTTFATINELSPDVVKLWNMGISLDKAYASEHVDEITQLAIKRSQIDGKGHLNNIPGVGNPNSTQGRPITQNEMTMFKRINPNLTEEEIKKRLSKQ